MTLSLSDHGYFHLYLEGSAFLGYYSHEAMFYSVLQNKDSRQTGMTW